METPNRDMVKELSRPGPINAERGYVMEKDSTEEGSRAERDAEAKRGRGRVRLELSQICCWSSHDRKL